MSDDKPINLTTLQAFAGGGSIALIAALLVGPLQEYFPTRREAQAQVESQKEHNIRIEKAIFDLRGEFKEKIADTKTEIINRIDSQETRSALIHDSITRRVDNLEASVFLKPKRSSN